MSVLDSVPYATVSTNYKVFFSDVLPSIGANICLVKERRPECLSRFWYIWKLYLLYVMALILYKYYWGYSLLAVWLPHCLLFLIRILSVSIWIFFLWDHYSLTTKHTCITIFMLHAAIRFQDCTIHNSVSWNLILFCLELSKFQGNALKPQHLCHLKA